MPATLDPPWDLSPTLLLHLTAVSLFVVDALVLPLHFSGNAKEMLISGD